MKPVRLVDYSRLYFDLSRDWISDPEINRLIDAGALPSNSDRESWFMSLPNRLDYKIWGVEYEGKPVGVCGLKHISNHEAEYWGYIGEKSLWGKGIGGGIFLLFRRLQKKLVLIPYI